MSSRRTDFYATGLVIKKGVRNRYHLSMQNQGFSPAS
jgi:hypothetical protein